MKILSFIHSFHQNMKIKRESFVFFGNTTKLEYFYIEECINNVKHKKFANIHFSQLI